MQAVYRLIVIFYTHFDYNKLIYEKARELKVRPRETSPASLIVATPVLN